MKALLVAIALAGCAAPERMLVTGANAAVFSAQVRDSTCDGYCWADGVQKWDGRHACVCMRELHALERAPSSFQHVVSKVVDLCGGLKW